MRARRIKAGTDADIAMNLSNFHLRIWKPLLAAAKVERANERGKLTFHSLRHCAATAAIASNANVQTVATLLGHASPQVTLTTYADPRGPPRSSSRQKALQTCSSAKVVAKR